MAKVLYVGQAVADSLADSIHANLERYLKDGFDDLVAAGNWSIPLNCDYDPAPLAKLSAISTPEVEFENSKLVWRSLGGALTPSLARENRIWVRMSHVECLEFSRNRWLDNRSDEQLEKSVRTHFFATSQTACRDDHAIGRLWWNGWIAHMADPDNQEQALRLILHSADVRSNLVERPWIFARPVLASSILRLMQAESWLLQMEHHFREFMKAVNLLGSGLAFESMAYTDIDLFLRRCLTKAQAVVAVASRKSV
jgi:hypothetical protein